MSSRLQGTILSKTEKAIRFEIDSLDNEEWQGAQKIYWIPISQIEKSFTTNLLGEDWIDISDWLAKKIGLV